jgi:hypothetical protein
MRHIHLLLLLLCLSALTARAQSFRGLVTDAQGIPIPHASLYIKNIHAGVMTNKNGSFSMRLAKGEYTIEASCPGYDDMTWQLHQTETGMMQNIVLNRRHYTLPDAKENENDSKAQAIIQLAIKAAPGYRNSILSYKADIYSKNREKLVKVPGIQKMSKSVRYLAKNYQGKLVVNEEHSKIDYQYPYSYNIQTVAKTTDLPSELNANIDIKTTNIYEGMIFGKLSPIAQNAMKYYRYILICTTKEFGHTIYKIQVVPRSLESVLVSGYIYIVDQLWCISGFNLLLFDSHIIADINTTCKEILPGTFMPITIQASINYHNTGFQALSHNIHSIKYHDLLLNNKDSIENREPPYPKGKHRFERILPKDMISISTVPGALNRDTLAWDSIRSVPLLSDEEESYRTIIPEQQQKKFHFNVKDLKDWGDIRTWYNFITKGDRFTSVNGKQWLDCYNLLSIVPEFNFVDGVWIGYKFGLGWRISHANTLEFTPSVYYTTGRRKWLAMGDITFTYAPRANGELSLKAGSTSQDYNEETGESRMFNAVSALIYADNYVKLFDKQYITLSNKIEPMNGMTFRTSFSWERRHKLENTLQHSILGGRAEANVPRLSNWTSMNSNRLLKLQLAFEYTPGNYYRIVDEKKVYERTENPTLSFSYTQAFRISSEEKSPSYTKLQAGIRQSINVGLFNKFIWVAEAGCFFNRNGMEFPDYHHFPTVQRTSTKRPFSYGFFLLDCYTFSTTERWAMLNTSWYTPYLLIKYLPFFRHKKFDEGIHLRVLATPDECPYIEASYSCGVEENARVGFCMGFDKNGYRSVGVSLSLAI